MWTELGLPWLRLGGGVRSCSYVSCVTSAGGQEVAVAGPFVACARVGGEEVRGCLADLPRDVLRACCPVRSPGVYQRQRHMPGQWFSTTAHDERSRSGCNRNGRPIWRRHRRDSHSHVVLGRKRLRALLLGQGPLERSTPSVAPPCRRIFRDLADCVSTTLARILPWVFLGSAVCAYEDICRFPQDVQLIRSVVLRLTTRRYAQSAAFVIEPTFKGHSRTLAQVAALLPACCFWLAARCGRLALRGRPPLVADFHVQQSEAEYPRQRNDRQENPTDVNAEKEHPHDHDGG